MTKEVEIMAVIDVRGDIIPNDTKWIYDWLEWDSTCRMTSKMLWNQRSRNAYSID